MGGGGKGNIEGGVKTISDCLEKGLNFFIKNFRGVCSLIRQLNFTQNEQFSDKNTKFIISKKYYATFSHVHMYVKLGLQILYAVEQFSSLLFKVICVYAVELSSKLFHCTSFWLSVPINFFFSCDTTFPLCSRFYGIPVKFTFSLAARSSEERRLAARFLEFVKRYST